MTPEEFAGATSVSRETLARLRAYVGLLTEWSSRHNLVSARSLEDVWRRHILDSAQLAGFIPAGANTLVDLGSGAGLPGLVLAVMLRDRPDFRTVLYEATRKKSEFLQAAAARLEVRVQVRNGRIEVAQAEPFDIVTARALAPLDKLLALAHPFQRPGTLNLFLKGQNVGAELTQASKSWRMKVERCPSASDGTGTVLAIRDIRHA